MLSFRKKFRVACIVVLTLIIVTTPFLTYRSVGLYVSPTSNREGSLISNITLTTYNSMEFKEPTEGKTPIFLTRHPETIKYHGIDLMSLPQYTFDPAYKNPCWRSSGRLRCFPYFFLVGVKKSGTSDLFRRILLHPDMVPPGGFKKEAQWFAFRRFQGKDHIYDYVNMFKHAAKVIEANTVDLPGTSKQYHPLITGDGSPSNLHSNYHWDFLPGNENLDEPKYVILDYIYHFVPKAKIIVVFREPIERLYSDYYHEVGLHHRINASATPEHFHQIVVEGLRMYNDCFQRHTLRSCLYNHSIAEKTHFQIQLGIYHVYWKELTRVFPRDQILVLQNKDCRNSSATMKKVIDFLELSPCSKTDWSKITETLPREHLHRKPMLQETQKMLYEFYRPHNIAMFKLTGDINFLYE